MYNECSHVALASTIGVRYSFEYGRKIMQKKKEEEESQGKTRRYLEGYIKNITIERKETEKKMAHTILKSTF